jgi:gas vesicle protein
VSKSEKKRGRSGVGLLVGLLLGIAVGVIIALLVAPQPGEDTRKQLSEQREQIRRRAGEALDQGREAYSRARDEVLNHAKDPVEA